MRVLVRVIFPSEAGTRAVRDPNFIKNTQAFIDNYKAEQHSLLPQMEIEVPISL
jgi:hypothetical protein